MKEKIQFIISRIEAKDGKAPEWFVLFEAGWIEFDGLGKALIDRKTYEAIASYMARRGNDIVIDYEHQTLKDVKAPAAGWITELRWTDGVGIEAKTEWNEEAKEYIEKKEYRYFSPVCAVRKSDKRVIAVLSVALTNVPRTNHLTPLIAKLEAEITEEETSMEFLKKIIAKLGLKEDAGEEDVLSEVKKLQNKPPETKEVVAKEVLDALDMETGDTSTVVASIHALKQRDKTSVSREEFEKLQDKLKEKDAEEVVAKAMKEGKVTPDQKDWAAEYAKRDLEGFKTFVAKAPVVIPLDKLPEHKKDQDPLVTDEAQISINKMMGIDEETFKKYAPKDAAA